MLYAIPNSVSGIDSPVIQLVTKIFQPIKNKCTQILYFAKKAAILSLVVIDSVFAAVDNFVIANVSPLMLA
jgi:hypothetical protein